MGRPKVQSAASLAAQILGTIGGRSKSRAKRLAAQVNGAKGGRPNGSKDTVVRKRRTK
jgi:hypothetical protein